MHYNHVHNTHREGQHKIGATKKAGMKSIEPKIKCAVCELYMFYVCLNKCIYTIIQSLTIKINNLSKNRFIEKQAPSDQKKRTDMMHLTFHTSTRAQKP